MLHCLESEPARLGLVQAQGSVVTWCGLRSGCRRRKGMPDRKATEKLGVMEKDGVYISMRSGTWRFFTFLCEL